jgi:DNA-directed RNA polymerase subunit RPC12/RpoP
MATYECSSCGMAVNASCAKCDTPLVNAIQTKEDGSEVQVSKCPDCDGKIKSPMCCGADMGYQI